MKGDFSRLTFDKKKHYNAVLKQQGRVDLDADWNEQQAITMHRVETETADLLGNCGAPAGNAGFQISIGQPTTGSGDFSISAGRMYVDGILCENDQPVLYSKQDDYPNPQPLTQQGLYLIYLDVWHRHITMLNDDAIREKALGGPDTTTRLKTVWQVKALPFQQKIFVAGDFQARVNDLLSFATELSRLNLSAEAKAQLAKVRTAGKQILKAKPQSINAFITQLDAQGFLNKLDQMRSSVPKEFLPFFGNVVDQVRQPVSGTDLISCCSSLPEWDSLIAPSTGMLNAQTNPVQDTTSPCIIPPSAGYTRLENQLYRVEIHAGGTLAADSTGGVTFKWSRDNGSVVTSITNISGSNITVHDLGHDEVLGFAPGQWVELSDDVLELNGEPGQLFQITQIVNEGSSPTITLSGQPTFVDVNQQKRPSQNPKLRRWDQVNAVTSNGDIPISTDWIDLESGVQVQFSSGTYKTGDYWLIPARTVTGDIEWPRGLDANKNLIPIPQLPKGIHHHYCRLALVNVANQNGIVIVTVENDCRKIYPTLAQCAMHIVGINWTNDDLLPIGLLTGQGLQITLDSPPDPQSVNSSSVIVTAEIQWPNSTVGETANVVLDGSISIDSNNPNVIVWKMAQQDQAKLSGARSEAIDIRGKFLPRFRVKVKGRIIWDDGSAYQGAEITPKVFLDGQAFGLPSIRKDGKTPCTKLILPSGNADRASDFESWFWLDATPPPPTISVTYGLSQDSDNGTMQQQGILNNLNPGFTYTLITPNTVTPVNNSETGSALVMLFDNLTPNQTVDVSFTLPTELFDVNDTSGQSIPCSFGPQSLQNGDIFFNPNSPNTIAVEDSGSLTLTLGITVTVPSDVTAGDAYSGPVSCSISSPILSRPFTRKVKLAIGTKTKAKKTRTGKSKPK